ncbi:exocyst complex component Sec10-domain-containing protein [Phycomyces blakesleeanus]|uniref:Exocyst complex component Sec10-domain-containing protein n=1 Tax=Phycomyces blakesleeanus TaxID=4837 RepID=A0ABR3B1G7_PHYBL
MDGPSDQRIPMLYNLSSGTQHLLTIENFKARISSTQNKMNKKKRQSSLGNVSTNAFIELISQGIIDDLDEKEQKAAFDPKPFIRTFENVLDELSVLRTHVQEQCDELESSVQVAELQYRKSVVDLHGSFDEVYRSYDNLESRIGEVGKTAIRIGEQLESIDKQRSRASESRDIIEYYMEFQEDSSERLDSLRYHGGDEGQVKAAIIARRLSAVAKEVDANDEAKASIEKFCESFEKEILEEFDMAYKDGDPRIMGHCAKVLFEFNGGASCIQTYVNQHEFFMSNMKIEEMEELRYSEDHSTLSDPNVPPPEVDTSLVKLYDDIRITVRREAEIISNVFPQPATVMQVFLQRIFEQSIQDHVERLLMKAERMSNLAYLRMLASTHAETKRLIENLKFYCDKEASFVNSVDANGLVASISLDQTLDRCMADLFVPYTEGERYLTRERLTLNELFGSIVAEFLSYMQQRKKTSLRNQSVLTRTLNQISASTSSGLSPIPPVPMGSDINGSASPTNPFERSSEPRRAISNLVKVDDNGFCLISNETILRALSIHAEAIVRCVELSDTQDLPSSIKKLYGLLVDFMDVKYLDIVLDDVIEELGNTKVEPEMTCFPVIKTTTHMIQLLQEHFQTAVVPLVACSPAVHKEILINKNSFMSLLEHKVNTLLQKIIDSASFWLGEILARQKKNDFRPKDEEVVMMSMGTLPCLQSVEFITRIYKASCKTLQGKNLEMFLMIIGNGFHAQLLDHFKKYFVTPTGGLLVTKDIAKYQEVIRMFKIPSLDDRFEVLRQIGNMFLVKPEILRSILSEGYLARLDPSALYPYLEKRVDFKSAKLDRLLGISVDENGAVTKATGDTGGKTQRRSLFVSDNVVLKEMMKNYNNNREFLSAFNLA